MIVVVASAFLKPFYHDFSLVVSALAARVI